MAPPLFTVRLTNYFSGKVKNDILRRLYKLLQVVVCLQYSRIIIGNFAIMWSAARDDGYKTLAPWILDTFVSADGRDCPRFAPLAAHELTNNPSSVIGTPALLLSKTQWGPLTKDAPPTTLMGGPKLFALAEKTGTTTTIIGHQKKTRRRIGRPNSFRRTTVIVIVIFHRCSGGSIEGRHQRKEQQQKHSKTRPEKTCSSRRGHTCAI